jgi:hypothetical protein
MSGGGVIHDLLVVLGGFLVATIAGTATAGFLVSVYALLTDQRPLDLIDPIPGGTQDDREPGTVQQDR